MKVAILMLIAAAYVGGYGYGRWYAKPARRTERKPLYWVDPMHPWYKSDKPGIAPDCGMKLVPVYPATRRATNAAPTNCPDGMGSVQITPRSSSSSAWSTAPPNTKPPPAPYAPRRA
jgi:hypothetical protein